MRGAGVSTCAGETTKNIFPRKDNSSHFIYGNRGEESGGGKGKGACEEAGIEQGWYEEERSAAPLNCSVPSRHRWWRQEGNAWREDVRWTWACFAVATHRECAKELMLRCVAEVTNVSIPVQVWHTFQTRDFLPVWTWGSNPTVINTMSGSRGRLRNMFGTCRTTSAEPCHSRIQ